MAGEVANYSSPLCLRKETKGSMSRQGKEKIHEI